MVWQTKLLLGRPLSLDHLTGFVFFATLFLYAVHRIVGISRLKEFFDVDRYKVIARFKSHIFLYALVAAIGTLYCFVYLSFHQQMGLIIPGIFSLAYVVPFLGNRRRLRDVNHIKIYLIALVWAFVTVSLPAMEWSIATTLPVLVMTAERALFIFIITLPFDIRDLKVDSHGGVKTIPAMIGLQRTIQLGYALSVLFVGLVLVNFFWGTYSLSDTIALTISAFINAWLLSKSRLDRHDYFYSGLMDGTMILQFLLIVAGKPA